MNLFFRLWIGDKSYSCEPGESVPVAIQEAVESTKKSACVFVHAFPLDSRMWEPTLRWTSSAGHPAFAFDLPGFGRSKAVGYGKEVLDIPTAAREVLDCLDALSIRRAVLVGCSMGGYVIFSMLRSLPEKVSGLLLSDTRAAADSEEARQSRYKAIETIRSGRLEDFWETMEQRLLAPGRTSHRMQLSRQLAAIMKEQEDWALVAALRGLAQRPDATDLLFQIDVPCVVAVGEKDSLVPIGEAKALADAIPGAALEVIPGAGHLPNLEAPQQFQAALSKLLSQVEEGIG